MGALRQTNFAAGELSPLLWGRTDLSLYRAGLRRLRDFYVNRQGMAVSRPGTRHCGPALSQTQASVLVPFLVSDDDGYLLELSNTAVRAWRRGVVVWTGVLRFFANGPGVSGPVQYAQSGDVLYIANRGLQRIRRTGDTAFVVEDNDGGQFWVRASPEWVALPTGARTTTPALVSSASLATPTATSPLRPWRWWVSALLRDDNGRTFESDSFEVTQVVDAGGMLTPISATGTAVGADRPVTLRRRLSGTLWAGARLYEVLSWNYYRGVGEFSGFVGNTTTELDFVDDGREPDYTLPRPSSANPFFWTTPTGPRVDRPASVAFYEDKLVFGGTLLRPNSLLLSATGDYLDFGRRAVVTPNQPLELELAVRKRETVRGLAALQRLLALTDAGVWAVGGQGALTPDSVQARLVSEVGSAWLRPLVLGGDVLYVRGRGVGLRVVRQSDNAPELYSSADVSWHAQHLFEGVPLTAPIATTPHPGVILDWAWQEEPQGLVWAVRADGRMLVVQWNGEVAGVGLATTGAEWGDRFEAVAVVPEGDEDTVYVCTQRAGGYAIERFASRTRRGTVVDDCCVDAAVAFTASPGSPVLSGLPATLNGRQVWVCAKDNAPVGPLTVTAGSVNLATQGGRLPIANDGANVTGWVGLLYQPELETLDVVSAESRLKQKSVVKVGLEVDQTRGLQAGQYATELSQAQLRDVSNVWLPPSAASAVIEVYVRGGWDLGARATLKQALPLPVTVLGITREVDGGG